MERFITNGWAGSQSDFANRCGVSHSALSTWLSGSKWPATWARATRRVRHGSTVAAAAGRGENRPQVARWWLRLPAVGE